MELIESFHMLKKRLSLIILITLTAALSTGILSFFVIHPKYNASVSIIIAKQQSDINSPSLNYDDVVMYQKMVKTYSKLSQSIRVSQDVIEKLNLQPMKASDLLSMIEVTQDPDTQFLTITATSKDPKQAMDIANQFAESLKDIGIKVNKVDIVMIIDEAQLPAKPYSPKPFLNIAIALTLGLLFSVGLAFLLEYMDNTIKIKKDVEILGLSFLGTISLTRLDKTVKTKEDVQMVGLNVIGVISSVNIKGKEAAIC